MPPISIDPQRFKKSRWAIIFYVATVQPMGCGGLVFETPQFEFDPRQQLYWAPSFRFGLLCKTKVGFTGEGSTDDGSAGTVDTVRPSHRLQLLIQAVLFRVEI